MSCTRRIAYAALIAIGLLAVGLLTGGQSSAEAKEWKKIRIGTEGAYPPFNFIQPDGKLAGFEIDLANDLCQRIKAECEIVVQDWDGIIPALNASKFDAIMSGMSITDKRKEVIAFSAPYTSTPSAFGVLTTSALAKLPGAGQKFSLATDPEDAQKAIDAIKPMLKGKVIGVQDATIQLNFLEKYLKDVVEIRRYKTIEEHALDLQSERIDAEFTSLSVLNPAIEKAPDKNLTAAGPMFTGGVFGLGSGVGMRKSDEDLKALFDTAIKSAIADGTVKTLAMKWFKFDVTPG
ncbi:MAG TPA: transporter substrate-binding domain-containing protein [Stellaceae bacterium]|nr:transporter substrate-binding domain-containing protein [Stellaceae bacterium]